MINPTYSRKTTARARWKREFNGIIEERAVSCVQKFYLNRSVKYERLLSSKGFYVNPPLAISKNGNEITVKYQKVFNVTETKTFYKIFSEKKTKGNTALEKRKSLCFLLSAWPKSIHLVLKCTEEYNLYRTRLFKHAFNQHVFEHGDFRPNNILNIDNVDRPLILDLEFARPYQPPGFDEFDFKQYALFSQHFLLNRAKYKFANMANDIIDKQGIIKIKITSKNLKNVLTLYQKIHKIDKRQYYNLDIHWQLNWIRSFKPRNLRAYILVKDNEAQAICLCHSVLTKRGKLVTRPIGQAPDCEDYFAFPSVSRDFELEMIELLLRDKSINIFITNFPMNENEKNKLMVWSKCIDTVLHFKSEKFYFKKKKKNEINRLKNNLKRDYGLNYSNLTKTIDNASFEVFYTTWIKRWGFSKKRKKSYKRFYQLNLKSNLMELYVLKDTSSNTILAYQFCYIEQKGLISHIPVINSKFKSISPGRLLLFEMLVEDQLKFCFGRGREPYKLWFSPSEQPIYELS